MFYTSALKSASGFSGNETSVSAIVGKLAIKGLLTTARCSGSAFPRPRRGPQSRRRTLHAQKKNPRPMLVEFRDTVSLSLAFS
jgi:hypothetical protein